MNTELFKRFRMETGCNFYRLRWYLRFTLGLVAVIAALSVAFVTGLIQ